MKGLFQTQNPLTRIEASLLIQTSGEPDLHDNTPKNDPKYSGSSIITDGCVCVTEELQGDSESSCSMDPVMYLGDFGRLVKLQSEQRLTDDKKYIYIFLSTTLPLIKSIIF